MKWIYSLQFDRKNCVYFASFTLILYAVGIFALKWKCSSNFKFSIFCLFYLFYWLKETGMRKMGMKPHCQKAKKKKSKNKIKTKFENFSSMFDFILPKVPVKIFAKRKTTFGNEKRIACISKEKRKNKEKRISKIKFHSINIFSSCISNSNECGKLYFWLLHTNTRPKAISKKQKVKTTFSSSLLYAVCA